MDEELAGASSQRVYSRLRKGLDWRTEVIGIQFGKIFEFNRVIYSDIFRMNGCNMGNLEEIYIIKRRIKAFFHSLVYYACHIFPVQKNKIVMWTFEGSGGYACSPKYIAEEIFRRNSLHQSDFEIYWLTSNMDK